MITRSLYFLLVILVLFCESSSKVAPDFITPCPGQKSDCLIKNIQDTIPFFVKGIPELGINSTDPLHVNKINLVFPGGLKIEFYDGLITGFKKCIVEKVKFEDFATDLQLKCSMNLKGKYKATGKILLFTIDGEGDAKVKIPEITYNAKIHFEDKIKNGVEYREVKEYKVDYRYGQRVTFDFTNLFKGNPVLSETVLSFLNDNWKEVTEEFGSPITDTCIRMTFNTIKKFFQKIPKSELYVE